MNNERVWMSLYMGGSVCRVCLCKRRKPKRKAEGERERESERARARGKGRKREREIGAGSEGTDGVERDKRARASQRSIGTDEGAARVLLIKD